MTNLQKRISSGLILLILLALVVSSVRAIPEVAIYVLASLTFFLSFGLEEIPYPEGAIMFHSKPIAISLMIFFISSVPILYKIADNQKGCSNKSAKTLSSQEKENDNEGREEATLEDLESGNYDPI